MEKTKEQLILAFKKANKEYREKLAKKAGFTSGDEYLASLQKKAKVTSKKTEPKKGLFYVIDVFDASGSMEGGKYNNSKSGIVEGIKDLQKRTDVKYSLVEFVDNSKQNNPITKANPSDIILDKINFNG